MTNQQIVSWLSKSILFLLFLTPFTVLLVGNSLFFPFITGKAFFFRSLMEIAFGLWLVLLLFDRSYLPKRSLLIIGSSLFVTIIAVADFFGVNPSFSFWSNFERMEGLVAILHIWAYTVLLSSVLRTEKIWTYFLQTTIGVSVLVSVYSLLQLAGHIGISQGSTRLDATLGNSAYLGTFMFFNLFLTFYLWGHSAKDKFPNLIYGLTAVLQLIVLYYSGTRGAILGFLAGILLILGLAVISKKTDLKLRKIAGGFLLSLIILGMIFYAAKDTSFIQSNPVLKRFAAISLQEKTARSRFMIWTMAGQGFKDRPILGWGQDNFIVVFDKYYNPKMYDQEPWFDRTHNIFLDWLIAGGILGLLSYLFIYLLSFRNIWHSLKFSRGEKFILAGLISGYLVQNLFIFDNITSYILFFGLIVFIDQRDFLDNNSQPTSGLKEKFYLASPYFKGGLILVILIFIIATNYFLVTKPYLASQSLLDALRFASTGSLGDSLNSFKKSIAYNTTGRVEAREQLVSFTIQVLTNENVSVADKQTIASLAFEEIKQEIKKSPLSARVLVIVAELMRVAGQYDEALKYYDQALVLSPKKQSFLFNQAVIYLNKNEPEKAFATIKQAFELEESYDNARAHYAYLAFITGRAKLASELLLSKFGTLAVDNDSILNYYVQTKRLDLVEKIWHNRTISNPTVLQNWFSYAGSLLAQNRNTEAVKVMEEALKHFPDNQDQVKQALEAIKSGRAVAEF